MTVILGGFFMRKKIILGIVILAVIVILFNNFAVVNTWACGKHIVNTNVTEIRHGYRGRGDKERVFCTPSLKKLKKLESLDIMVNEDTDYKYLSQMSELQELNLYYQFSYCGMLENLPELSNLKKLIISGGGDGNNFTLSDEYEYNFSSIENLRIEYCTSIDCDALKHFKNLKKLYLQAAYLLADMECFSELQYLESAEFYVHLKESDLFDLSGLKNNKNLKSLTVGNYYKEKYILKNTDCFSDLASVEELKIENISFENIDGLLKMKSLKNLNITDDCLTEKQIEELQSRGINVEIV